MPASLRVPREGPGAGSARALPSQLFGSGGRDAELLRGHPGAFDPVRDLLERDVARVVRRAVERLLVDAEGGETAVVRRAETVLRDEVGRPHEQIADLLRALYPRVLRVDHADVAHLR